MWKVKYGGPISVYILDLQLLINVFLLLAYCSKFASSQEINRLPDIPGSWKEKELLRDLLHDYEKKARPVVDGVSPIAKLSETLSVQQISIEFALSLIQILELDENEQVLTTSIRTLYRWKDYHMVWDPAEYGNITSVQMPTSQLWLPDIALYNYADERLEERRHSDLQVSYTGTVEWQPQAIYKSACFVHIKYFPFDQQNCSFKFGPWTYDAARTNITFYNNSDGWFLEDYEESPEWELLGTKAVFTGVKYQCCDEVYPDITFYMVIKRQPAFYNYVVILPCFLLSSLTLVLFCLPAETPAKMQLGMTMFQAFNFLLLILTQSIPSGASSFPLIGTYYCINMFLVTLSTFLCLIIVNCHFRGDSHSEVPRWAKKIFLEYGARLLFITTASAQAAKRNLASTKVNNVGGGGGGVGGVGLWRRAAADAEALHPDKSIRPTVDCCRSSACQTVPSRSRHNHIRDSSRGNCSCETVGHMCGGGGGGGGFYSSARENLSVHPTGPPLCLDCQHQSADICCQQWQVNHCHPCQVLHHTRINYACEECNTYREQEPPSRLPPPSTHQRTAQPKSPFAEDEATNTQHCPACAGLAASSQDGEMSDTSFHGPSGQQQKDLDAALADVWASAAHHRSGRSTGMIPPAVSRRPANCNAENLLAKCISPDGTSGGSPLLYASDCTSCQQCDAERYNTTTTNNNGNSTNTGPVGDTDVRVLRRVAAVTRDIGEIVRGIRYFQRKNEDKERVQKIINEWRTVGGVLDRLFFICYLFAISISIILYFPRPADSG